MLRVRRLTGTGKEDEEEREGNLLGLINKIGFIFHINFIFLNDFIFLVELTTIYLCIRRSWVEVNLSDSA